MIPLPIHLFIHFSLAILVGWSVGNKYGHLTLGLVAGVLGGFLIDLDHLLEYLLVFGSHFNLVYFFEGRQFLASSQVHLWFHAWEYALILLLAAWIFRKNIAVFTFIIALTFGGVIHLMSDCIINQYPPQNYSLIYRVENNFAAEKLLNPQQYEKFLKNKQSLSF